jgi:hypothetical protein
MQMHGWVQRIEEKLGLGTDRHSDKKRRILKHLTDRTVVARDVSHEGDQQTTFGQWLADRVAQFGGSWTFISIFLFILFAWTTTNAFILLSGAFDPYPFIFLNLLLSWRCTRRLIISSPKCSYACLSVRRRCPALLQTCTRTRGPDGRCHS